MQEENQKDAVSQDKGHRSASAGTDKPNTMRSNVLSVKACSQCIGDLGENIFSEVVGLKARVQQDEDQIGSQEVEAANVDKSSIDEHHLRVKRLIF